MIPTSHGLFLLEILSKLIFCAPEVSSNSDGGIVSRWNTPGGPQLVTYLALTTLPLLVNQLDGDQHYCWSKHFSRTFISFRSVLLRYRWNYMKAISLPASLCGLRERWDSGIKPTCSALSRRACGVVVRFLCAPHTCISYVFVCVSWH